MAAACETSEVSSPSLVLASASPRRHEILGRLTTAFTVAVADVDERTIDGETPVAYVTRLAETKARRVAVADSVVIGADTSVVLDGHILGKPRDRADAAATLRRLAGRPHEVISGVAVVHTDAKGTERVAIGHERTTVAVRDLSDERIAWYVATGEADDKAGSYGLQGAGGLFADVVEGSVSNVIGLPLGLLDELVASIGFDLVATAWPSS